MLDGGLVFGMGGRWNGAESFVRVDDRICDHDWVGGGDPLEN